MRHSGDHAGTPGQGAAGCRGVNGDGVGFVLAGGGELSVADGHGCASGDRVTLAVRPERIDLDIPDASRVSGKVENVVYFGTDTTYHVMLPRGARVQVRVQNRTGSRRKLNPGDAVGITFPPDAVRVLRS